MKVIFLYNGNSKNIYEWSNVPYFVTETFKELGHEVIRIDMRIKYIKTIYDCTITMFVKRFLIKNTSYNFIRSKLRGIMTDIRLKRIVKKNPDTDLYFCISDNYNPYKYTNTKCVMLCDWTYEFEILHDLHKHIDKYETYYYRKQLQMMKHAHASIILRDECRDYVIKKHPQIPVYNKKNIIVQCTLPFIDKEHILSQKMNSTKIVFIGSKRYLNGAKALYDAADEIRRFIPNVEIYFLGISKKDLCAVNEECKQGCHFCGYLNKGIEADNKLYYELLTCAKLCINTNDGFVSIGGLIEAGYLYNPVIISKHYQTLGCYGENILCGYYCNNNKEEIIDAIRKVFAMSPEKYAALCQTCHEHFKDNTWTGTVSKWIETDFKG